MISQGVIGDQKVGHQRSDIEVVHREERGVVPLIIGLEDRDLVRETAQ